jgi:hypothetical protein
MLRIDTRLRYAARRTRWPAHWRDYRAVAGRAGEQRRRVDFLGVAGIGKTTFTKELAYALGERVPRCNGKKSLSDDWANTFDDIYRNHFVFSATEDDSWLSKHRRTVHLTDVVHREKEILQCDSDQIVLNGVSILRHRLSYFVQEATHRPEFVTGLLSDRIVVLCTSKDPIGRSIEGKITRGDKDSHAEDLEHKVAERVEKIHSAVEVLKNLGVPVLELDLDLPKRYAISHTAQFMHDNGMRSGPISRHRARLTAS